MRPQKHTKESHYKKSVHLSFSENMLFTDSQKSETKALAQIAHLSLPYISGQKSNIWDIHNLSFLNLKIKLSFLNKLHIMHFF